MHLHFTGWSPFSSQKSSLNGLGAIQAEGSCLYYAPHPRQGTPRPGPAVHTFLPKWCPHSGCDRPGPPRPACGTCWSEHCSTRQLHHKTWRQLVPEPLPAPEPPPSPPACSQRLSSHHSGLDGSTLAACHTSLPPSSLPISTLSMPPEAARWNSGSGSSTVKGNCIKLWASGLPWQKTYWLAQLVATETSHSSANENFCFRRCCWELTTGCRSSLCL